MQRRYDDDLFADSTMSFGDHLEELRSRLIKALLGFGLALLVGLYFGDTVVKLIERPLTKALAGYYEAQSSETFRNAAATESQKADAAKRAEDLIVQKKMLADEVFVDPAELVGELKKRYPKEFSSTPDLPKAKSDETDHGLMRIFLWHRQANDDRLRLKSLSAGEPFNVYMKASLLVGAVIASPWIFYQLWSFVAAGLYPHERRYVHIFLPLSVGLFLLGTVVAFVFAFDFVLSFLLSFNSWIGIDPDPRISEWVSFFLVLPIGFGVGFQLPLVMFFLDRVGILTADKCLAYWRAIVMAIVVISGILTPPDPYSILVLAIPLTILFFGGIALSKLMPRKQAE